VKSIELVELDLESVRVELESAQRRIGAGNTQILVIFYSFLHFSRARDSLVEQVSIGIDRARQARHGISESRVGISS
jgi:hypothetical protein